MGTPSDFARLSLSRTPSSPADVPVSSRKRPAPISSTERRNSVWPPTRRESCRQAGIQAWCATANPIRCSASCKKGALRSPTQHSVPHHLVPKPPFHGMHCCVRLGWALTFMSRWMTFWTCRYERACRGGGGISEAVGRGRISSR